MREHAAQWQGWLTRMKDSGGLRPSAIDIAERISPAHPLGVDPSLKGVSSSSTSVLNFCINVQADHPNKVLLVRIGEFYEAFGYSALALAHYCGLNPMGLAAPRAGTPVVNLRRTLRDLTDEGFSVVVCEEIRSKFGAKKRKERFVGGIVTPASPTYLHDLLLADDLHPELAPAVSVSVPLPVLAVCHSARGWSLHEVFMSPPSLRVLDGLTEDAVAARVAAASFSPPLYHAGVPPSGPLSRAIGQILTAHKLPSLAAESTKAFHACLLPLVCKELGLPPGTEFAVHARQSGIDGTPRPLYLSTARQLGLVPTIGIPALVDHLLPPEHAGGPGHALCKNWVREWLLTPPPFDVAAQVHAACGTLVELRNALPDFPARLPGRFAHFIVAQEASGPMFNDLHHVLNTCATAFDPSKPELQQFVRSILQ